MNWLFPNPRLDHDRIVAAIRAAEKGTSGEIRVVVSRRKTTDPVAAAMKQFERLGMVNTSARNGVLIFVAPKSRLFAVIGDAGVDEKCGQDFWTELTAAMADFFKRAEFTEGLVHGIERAGALLAQHFPRDAGDRNELADDVEETD